MSLQHTMCRILAASVAACSSHAMPASESNTPPLQDPAPSAMTANERSTAVMQSSAVTSGRGATNAGTVAMQASRSASAGMGVAANSQPTTGVAGVHAAGADAAGAHAAGSGGNVTGAAGASQIATMGLPPVNDIWQMGPLEVTQTMMAGPSQNGTVIHPRELGRNGLKHPIVVFGNGATITGPSVYANITRHAASYGFVVYNSYQSTNSGTELKDGLDWLIAENSRSGSPFEGKLNTSKTAAMGHSLGSLATFAIAADPRLTTTLHLSGGTMPTHEAVDNLRAPAAFICGEDTGNTGVSGSGDLATPNCKIDFMNAKVPVFFAEIKGASHLNGFMMMQGAVTGWLRWRLMDDASSKSMFVGSDCDLCKRMNWVVMQKDLM